MELSSLGHRYGSWSNNFLKRQADTRISGIWVDGYVLAWKTGIGTGSSCTVVSRNGEPVGNRFLEILLRNCFQKVKEKQMVHMTVLLSSERRAP